MATTQATFDQLLDDFQKCLKETSSPGEVLALKAQFLGKKAALSKILQGLKDAPPPKRQELGGQANALKDKIQHLSTERLANLERQQIDRKLAAAKHEKDWTLRDRFLAGSFIHAGQHPLSIVQQEVEDIFRTMGMEVLDGPHIEDEWHNFEALNIPPDHPARDMQDTFWFHGQAEQTSTGKRYLLRTHTSTIQVRGMKERRPPFAFIAPGKVFRCERTDASHEMVFHQLEGMLVGRDISVANLIYFMKTLLAEIFNRKVAIRLRPGHFPFVEPGFELDIECLLCGGKGCSVCKHIGYVELLPCGMIHPHVLCAGEIDPEKWSGFAFGLGLDRLVMMKYAIDDIRLIHGADLRFLQQFQSY